MKHENEKKVKAAADKCNQYRYEKFVEEDLVNILISIANSLAVIADKMTEDNK